MKLSSLAVTAILFPATLSAATPLSETSDLIDNDAVPVISEASKARAAELVSQMTLDEKLSYIGGIDGFYIREIPRLGIPRIRMADGPQGVRNDTKSTMYPCGIAAAATWNRDLAFAYGKSLGTDARARGVHIMLGPGVNIYRFPKCGRNFEYYGEDPYLTSETAVQYIKGMQSVGVMSTIKHFCGNNLSSISAETTRNTTATTDLPTSTSVPLTRFISRHSARPCKWPVPEQ